MGNITNKCKVSNCEELGHLDVRNGKRYFTNGFCNKHNQKYRKHGDPLYQKPIKSDKCKVEGCNYISSKLILGLCNSHWRQQKQGKEFTFQNNKARRDGFEKDGYYYLPLGIDARQGHARIDLGFKYLEKYNWICTKNGHCYRIRFRNEDGSKTKFLHHEIVGKPTNGLLVDHIDRDPKNNTKVNLRITTKSVNGININPRKSYTGIRGVNYNKKDIAYSARLIFEGKLYLLGQYKNIEDAIKARKAAELKYFGYNPN